MELFHKAWRYEDAFAQGRMSGAARIEYKNGSVYEGQVAEGLKHGFGRLTYKSGNYYEGAWRENVKEGRGKMVWLDRNEMVGAAQAVRRGLEAQPLRRLGHALLPAPEPQEPAAHQPVPGRVPGRQAARPRQFFLRGRQQVRRAVGR